MAVIGILGRRERAGTFSALGVRPYYAETARQAQEAFERMMKEECAVIFVDAEWQEALQAQALRCRDRVLPAVLFLPGLQVLFAVADLSAMQLATVLVCAFVPTLLIQAVKMLGEAAA